MKLTSEEKARVVSLHKKQYKDYSNEVKSYKEDVDNYKVKDYYLPAFVEQLSDNIVLNTMLLVN